MRRIILIFLLFVLFGLYSNAETCRRCNGSGKITIFSGKVGGYGLDPLYKECPICYKTVDATLSHKHVCPKCGGKGWIDGASSSSSSSSRTEDIGDDPLTASEREYVNMLIRESVAPNVKIVECSTCHGTGVCQSCKGSGYIAFMGSYLVCPACNGWHPEKGCRQCNGFGKITVKQKKTEAEVNEINKKIRQVHEEAMDRALKRIAAEYR